MSFATIAAIIGTFLWAIAALLVLLDEPDLGGLDPLGWFLVGAPFIGLSLWLPGSTHDVVVRGR